MKTKTEQGKQMIEYTLEQTQALQIALKYIHSFINEKHKETENLGQNYSFGYIFVWNMKTGRVINSLEDEFVSHLQNVNHLEQDYPHCTLISVSIANWGVEPELRSHSLSFNQMMDKFHKYHLMENSGNFKLEYINDTNTNRIGIKVRGIGFKVNQYINRIEFNNNP